MNPIKDLFLILGGPFLLSIIFAFTFVAIFGEHRPGAPDWYVDKIRIDGMASAGLILGFATWFSARLLYMRLRRNSIDRL